MNTQQLRPLGRFSEFQTEVPLSRELPYWDFMDDLVVLADGTLAMGFRLRGIAIETWDTEGINRMVTGFRAMLNSLPDGCEVSFISETGSDFEELIARHESLKGTNELVAWVADQRIAEIRRELAEHQILGSTLYAFVFRRFNPGSSSGPTASFKAFFSSPKRFQDVRRQEHEMAERELRQIAAQLAERFETNGVHATPLTGEQCWNTIYAFLNPRRSHDLKAPKPNRTHREQEFSPAELTISPELAMSSPREQLCFSDLIQGYESFVLDGCYHRVVTLKTLPEFTHSALVSRLAQLPFPHLLHVHVRVPEQSKELSTLQAKRRMAHSMSVTHGGRASDLESEARLQSTEELLRELINTGQKIFYFQAAVLIRADNQDDLDTRTKTVLSAIRELNGAEGLAETCGV